MIHYRPNHVYPTTTTTTSPLSTSVVVVTQTASPLAPTLLAQTGGSAAGTRVAAGMTGLVVVAVVLLGW